MNKHLLRSPAFGLPTLLVLLCTALPTQAQQAQTAQAAPKPAAKAPAAKAPPAAAAAAPAAATAAAPSGEKLGSLGKGTSGGPILSRDELRACLNQEASIRTRLDEMDTVRTQLGTEKQAIAADQQVLRGERAPLDALKVRADALSLRLKDYSARVENWNARVAAMTESKAKGSDADKARTELNAEREVFVKEGPGLEAEKAALTADSEAAVKVYNSKAQVVDARVTAWNTRNQETNDRATAMEAERATWVTACSDRRYREDDEIAIRKGK
jgi:hypothetical protein